MYTAYIDAENPVLGRARFVSISLPEKWQIRPAGYTDVELVREAYGDRWVASGYITLFMLRNGKLTALKITVKEPLLGFKLEKWLSKNSRRSIKSGFLEINGHRAGYIIREASRKRYLIVGDRIKWVKMNLALMCRETHRRINIVVEGSMTVEEAETLLEILSTLRCH